jgi:hypothetical protein
MRSARLLCVSALSGVLAVACSDPVSPTVRALDALFAELDETWRSSTNPVSVSPGVTHLTNRPSSSSCMYSPGTERYVCPTRTQNGLTSSSTFQLLDAGGAAQSTFVSGVTASVVVRTDISGSLVSPDAVTKTTIAGHSTDILSGLIGDVHTLNRTETAAFVFVTDTSSVTNAAVETTSNLVLGQIGSATPYPASGSITTLIFAGLTAAGVLLATVTATFNGTALVTLLILANGVTLTCIIDLSGAKQMTCS